MKTSFVYRHLVLLVACCALAFTPACKDNESVDDLVGAVPDTIEVPPNNNLSIDITNPAADGSPTGYQKTMGGNCGTAGILIRIYIDGTEVDSTSCAVGGTWTHDVDTTSAAVGALTVSVRMVDGSVIGNASDRILNKISTACDTLAARTARFANFPGVAPWQICTSAQLANLNIESPANTWIYENDNAELHNDVSFGGGAMQSMGSVAGGYTGTFEGNGFKISNVVIGNTGDDQQGMWREATGATFQNVDFENVTVQGRRYLGVLVGYVEPGTLTFSNINMSNVTITTFSTNTDGQLGGLVGSSRNNATVAVVANNIAIDTIAFNGIKNWTGGLMGYLNQFASFTANTVSATNVSISNRYAGGGILGGTHASSGAVNINGATTSGDITVSTSYAGGIIGLGDTTNITLTNVTSSTNVTVNGGTNDNYLGGVIGRMDGGTITTCNVTGSMSGTGQYIGGAVGRFSGTLIDGCTVDTPINADTTSLAINYVGGMVGYANPGGYDADFQNCNVEVNINVNGANVGSYYGGIAGRFRGTNISNCHATGDTGAGTPGTISVSTGDGATTGSNQIGGAFGRFDFSGAQTLTINNSNTDVDITLNGANANGYVGGYVGYVQYANGSGPHIINASNSTASGDITTFNAYAGGWVSRIYVERNGDGATFNNVHATGNITATSINGGDMDYIAGFGGYMVSRDDTSATAAPLGFQFTNCSATGNLVIDSLDQGGDYVGGFVGYAYSGRTNLGGANSFADQVSATGDITISSTSVDFRYVGSLFGRVHAGTNATFTVNSASGQTYATGNILPQIGTECDYCGGVFGYLSTGTNGVLQIDDVYGLGNVSGDAYVGGFSGYLTAGTGNDTDITNSYSNGNISGRTYVGGFISYVSNGGGASNMLLNNIQSHDSNGATAVNTVTGNGAYVGGLFGYATSSTANFLMSNCESIAPVTNNGVGSSYTGGAIGHDRDNIDITNCTTAVSSNVVSNGTYTGGFAGGSDRTGRDYTNVTSLGDVSVTLSTGAAINRAYIGGFSGYHRGNVTLMRAEGDVLVTLAGGTSLNNDAYIGGLIGIYNNGTLDQGQAIGDVTIVNPAGLMRYIGGLIGTNSRPITNSYATGTVTNCGQYCGGLIGNNSNTVSDSYATGDVSSVSSYVGGLIGQSTGALTDVYATGDVSSTTAGYAGGLTGRNTQTITQAYALGDVSGNGTRAGGLSGESTNAITSSFAMGDVTNASTYAGGLVGYTTSTMTDVFAAGDVAGTQYVGGLAGRINAGVGAATRVYALGAVSRSTGANVNNFGVITGLCNNDNRVANGYYNLTSSSVAPGLTAYAACNTTTTNETRGTLDANMLSAGTQAPVDYEPAFVLDCAGAAQEWCYPTSFTKKGEVTVYPYLIPNWAMP